MTQAEIVAHILSDDIERETVSAIVEALKFKGYIVSAVVAQTKPSESFGHFLERFWNYDTSPYVREKLIVGQHIHRRYTDIMQSRARTYWIPRLGTVPVGSITRDDIQRTLWKLATQKQCVYSRKKKC